MYLYFYISVYLHMHDTVFRSTYAYMIICDHEAPRASMNTPFSKASSGWTSGTFLRVSQMLPFALISRMRVLATPMTLQRPSRSIRHEDWIWMAGVAIFLGRMGGIPAMCSAPKRGRHEPPFEFSDSHWEWFNICPHKGIVNPLPIWETDDQPGFFLVPFFQIDSFSLPSGNPMGHTGPSEVGRFDLSHGRKKAVSQPKLFRSASACEPSIPPLEHPKIRMACWKYGQLTHRPKSICQAPRIAKLWCLVLHLWWTWQIRSTLRWFPLDGGTFLPRKTIGSGSCRVPSNPIASSPTWMVCKQATPKSTVQSLFSL